MNDNENIQLVIELIRQSTDKIAQAESRICNRLGKLEDFQMVSIEKQTELAEAVTTLRDHVKSLQDHVKKIQKVLFAHKKKALPLYLGASLRSQQLHRASSIIRN